MKISYKKLWKLLIDKNIKKSEMANEVGISSSTLAKISKDYTVSMEVLLKICDFLGVRLDEIMDTIKDELSYNKIDTSNFVGTVELLENVSNNKPKVVSMFSGAGGMDLGFIHAGYDIVYANDFDKDAQRVYKKNIGPIDSRSILDIEVDEIPNCDVLTAGFPCQPFSNAGNRGGVFDDRGNLYKECLRVIEDKQPKVIVFENVRGITSTKDENGNSLVDTIVNRLENNGIGYNVTYKLINSSDYGVPQNRHRLIMVGIRKDLNTEFVFPDKIEKKNLEIGKLLHIPADVPNQVDWKLSPQAFKLIKYIPEGGSWKNIPYEELPDRMKRIRDDMKKYRAPNFYRRFSENEIAGTITASAQPENCGIIHPKEDRRFNIREIARIQTFPDDFIFFEENVKAITAMYKVIGNAVPPKLAQVIAETIKEQIGNNW